VINPCSHHPETGQPCELLYLPKDNGRCRKCIYRVQYDRFLGGQTPVTPELVYEPKRTKSTTRKRVICWWAGCFNPPASRGLCKRHYPKMANGDIRLSLADLTPAERESVFRIIHKVANQYQVSWQTAAAILFHEGVKQFAKRITGKRGRHALPVHQL